MESIASIAQFAQHAWPYAVTDPGTMTERPAKKPPRRGIYLLPNLLTTGALFAGFYSIVAAIDGNFFGAAVAIYVAMSLDGLDGRVARMTSTESDFGKEFDSLADMVSFGLAPAIVTYQWGVERFSEYGALWGRLGWLAAFLYTVAAAFRLARFNTSLAVDDKHYFQGLPSPPAASGIAAMVWLSIVYEVPRRCRDDRGHRHHDPDRACDDVELSLPELQGLQPFEPRTFLQTVLIIPFDSDRRVVRNPPVVLFANVLYLTRPSAPAIWLWKRRRKRRRRA